MLKIAIYFRNYVPYLDDLFQKLSQLGVKVDYYIYGGYTGGYKKNNNVNYWLLNGDLNFSYGNYSRIMLSTKIKFDTKYAGVKYFDLKIISKILKEKYDFFIIEFSEPMTLILSLFLKIVGTKLISWNGMCITSPKLIRKLAEISVRFCVNISDYFFARSIYAKRYLMSKGANPQKISVIPHGIDIKKYNDKNDTLLKERLNLKNKKIVLYVGRLLPWKGVDYLIKAIKLVNVKLKDFHLLIIGQGLMENYLKNLVQQEHLESCVTFLGAIPNSDIHKYYSICDVHVAPSIVTKDMIEIFGIVFLEAMASKKPSIAFDIPSEIQNIVDNGETGFLVPEKDVDALAEKICILLSDDQSRLDMGKNARRKVEEYFSVDAVAEMWINTLTNIFKA